MRGLGAAVLVVVVVAASDARAQPRARPEPIELRYAAPEGCPDEAAFFTSVQQRVSATRSTPAEVTFDVRITVDEPTAVRGALVVTAGTQVTSRDVEGASCQEVANALALVAALAIEQRHATEAPRPRVPRESRGWRLTGGAGVARFARVTPETLIGIPLFATFEPSSGGPRFRIGAMRTFENDVLMFGGGTSAFRATVGRAEVCPFVFVLARVELAPCAGISAGVLDARGVAVDMPANEVRPWVAPDAVARLGLRLGPITVEVEGGISVPMVRDRFYLAPSTAIYHVPSVTTVVGTGLAVEFY